MYQTFEGLQSLYGPKRLADATPQVPGEALSVYWTEKLRAASATIDITLRRAGYSTPVDTALLETEAKLDMDALLAFINGVLALELGAPALIATAKGVESSASKARTILRDVVSGRVRLPFALNRKVVSSVRSPEQTDRCWTQAPALTDPLYARLRGSYDLG